MDWNYPHFSKEEMACKDGCGGLPEPEFMELLENIRVEVGFPLSVASGFRCVKHNEEVGKTGTNSPHSMGLAADITISGERALRLIEVALKHGVTGIGINQKGDSASRFVHIDTVPINDLTHPRPTIWSY